MPLPQKNSIFVAFALEDAAKAKLEISGDASVIIWTTTPWTLPSNLMLAVGKEELKKKLEAEKNGEKAESSEKSEKK